MYKRLFICILVIFLITTLKAQDIIIKENGDEIKAKVIEVGITEIKYKKFDNETGPVYTILKSELFMIKYENGTKELFELTVTPIPEPIQEPIVEPVQEPVQEYIPPVQEYVAPVQTTPNSVVQQTSTKNKKNENWKRNVFNWNFKFGVLSTYLNYYDFVRFIDFSVINMGFGYIHNFNPWFGWEFINVQLSALLSFNGISIDFMTGPRVYLASLNRKVTPFLQVKTGYESGLLNWSDGWVPIEGELGVNFGRTFYISFGWHHCFHVVGYTDHSEGMLFGRLGFNF